MNALHNITCFLDRTDLSEISVARLCARWGLQLFTFPWSGKGIPDEERSCGYCPAHYPMISASALQLGAVVLYGWQMRWLPYPFQAAAIEWIPLHLQRRVDVPRLQKCLVMLMVQQSHGSTLKAALQSFSGDSNQSSSCSHLPSPHLVPPLPHSLSASQWDESALQSIELILSIRPVHLRSTASFLQLLTMSPDPNRGQRGERERVRGGGKGEESYLEGGSSVVVCAWCSCSSLGCWLWGWCTSGLCARQIQFMSHSQGLTHIWVQAGRS